ncbi:BMA-NTL-3, isoform c [Aphelenchoides besseyi]|nr:BMA-NTL-3, isoform c [Aphelenchoides besseyi]
MAEKRKLQIEMEKCFKKRLREQVKNWQGFDEIKDKDKLNRYRRLIEERMELFKDVERENKTKPHSNQGLSAEEKLDPKEKEKSETLEWLNAQIRKIQDEIDRTESKIETFTTAADTGRKRGKNKDEMKRADKEKVDELKKHLERVTFNLTNLEVCMRLILNEKLTVEEVNNKLRDPLDMYVDALGPEYDDDLATLETMEPDDVYNELNLGDYINQLRVVNCPLIEKEKPIKSPSESPPPEEMTKTRNLSVFFSSVSTIRPAVSTQSQQISYAAAAARASPPDLQRNNNFVTSQSSNPSITVRVPTPPVSIASSPTSVLNVTETTNSTIPFSSSLGVASNHPTYAAVAAANNSSSATPPLSTTSNVLTVAEEQERDSPPVEMMIELIQRADSVQSDDKRESQLLKSPATSFPALLESIMKMQELNDAINGLSNKHFQNEVPKEVPTTSIATQTSFISPFSDDFSLPFREPVKKPKEPSHLLDTFADRMYVPSESFLFRSNYTSVQEQQPTLFSPASYYPQETMPNVETVDYYTRLQPETLFFAFYYLEGTKAQLLAARALKTLAWRYHKKHLQWFQRLEQPTKITDDYEFGRYVTFNYEAWTIQKLENFTFEYKYLEDRDI